MQKRKQNGQIVRIGNDWHVRYWLLRNVGGVSKRTQLTHQLGPVGTREGKKRANRGEP
jgi:hypothetical protein